MTEPTPLTDRTRPQEPQNSPRPQEPQHTLPPQEPQNTQDPPTHHLPLSTLQEIIRLRLSTDFDHPNHWHPAYRLNAQAIAKTAPYCRSVVLRIMAEHLEEVRQPYEEAKATWEWHRRRNHSAGGGWCWLCRVLRMGVASAFVWVWRVEEAVRVVERMG